MTQSKEWMSVLWEGKEESAVEAGAALWPCAWVVKAFYRRVKRKSVTLFLNCYLWNFIFVLKQRQIFDINLG